MKPVGSPWAELYLRQARLRAIDCDYQRLTTSEFGNPDSAAEVFELIGFDSRHCEALGAHISARAEASPILRQ
jgi:hypothetical protein